MDDTIVWDADHAWCLSVSELDDGRLSILCDKGEVPRVQPERLGDVPVAMLEVRLHPRC